MSQDRTAPNSFGKNTPAYSKLIPLAPVYVPPSELQCISSNFPGYPEISPAEEKINAVKLFKGLAEKSPAKLQEDIGDKHISLLTLNDEGNDHILVRLVDQYMVELATKNAAQREKNQKCNIVIDFNDRIKGAVYPHLQNIKDKLSQKIAEKNFSHITISFSDKIDEAYALIARLKFSSKNPAQAALEEWKKSLVSLQNKAGQNEEKLEVVDTYVTQTQAVINAFEAFSKVHNVDVEASNVALVNLQNALSSFQVSVLSLSADDKALLGKAIEFGAVIGAVVGLSIAFPIVFSLPAFGIVLLSLAVPFLMTYLGIMCASVAARQSMEATAVDPVGYGDPISDKLIAFGIFGNGPKHKARHFFDAVKTQKDEPQVGKVSLTEGDQNGTGVVEPQLNQPVLMPVYQPMGQ